MKFTWLMSLLLIVPFVAAHYSYGSASGYERIVDHEYLQFSESEYTRTADYYGSYSHGVRNYDYGRSRSVNYGRYYSRERRDSHGSESYGYWYDGGDYGYVPYASYSSQYPMKYPVYGYGFYK